MTANEIVANLVAFLVAGYDTTRKSRWNLITFFPVKRARVRIINFQRFYEKNCIFIFYIKIIKSLIKSIGCLVENMKFN